MQFNMMIIEDIGYISHMSLGDLVGRAEPPYIVLAVINSASPEYLWNDESPLWLRPQYRNVESFRHDKYIQVVGHTPVDSIYEKDGYISTDVFSTYRDGQQIGEAAMIVIDSETGKYEKVGVPGKRIIKISTVTIQDNKS